VRHVVLGTAGHVDHGKTSLVFALTRVQTDRLPEEQRRGITIELGFAPWRIADDLLVSVIDAPGHRKLVHHMIAGASGIEIALLVVAADEGVMPQTREHVAACELLGVRTAVVAVTKADRVDADLAALAGEEAQELCGAHGIDARVVACSSKTGEGLDALRGAVIETIGATAPRARSRRVRLSVDRAFTVHGAGTVVTGTLVEGELGVGEPLRILGAGHERAASVRGLHIHGEACARAAAPTRLALNLGGVALDEVARGDVITNDAFVTPSRVLDVWLKTRERVRRGSDATIFVGTARSTAKLIPAEDETDGATPSGDGQAARLRLTTPLVVFGGDRFVLRGARVDGPAGAVIGGGRILDAHAPLRVRARKRLALLGALRDGDAARSLGALALETSPMPLALASLRARFSVSEDALEQAGGPLARDGDVVALRAGGELTGWIARPALDALLARATELVAEHHRASPLDPGMRLQTLREQLASISGAEATTEALARLTGGKSPALVVEGDMVRSPTFRGAAEDAAATRALETARAVMREAALQGLSEASFMQLARCDAKQARALLAALAREGHALRASDLWFDGEAVQALRARVVTHLERDGELTIQQFKDMTGLGRKQTIPLLEHFDRERVTRRVGDTRKKGA
jgi:selenocysteine-specific elongation factor